IYGDDYPTHDGTAVRDYIHVVDLARAHARALEYMRECDETFVVNVGTGCGYSVLDVVAAFESVSGCQIPLSYMPRRAGDIAKSVASPISARQRLRWEAEYDLHKMCEDAWRWQSTYPHGYRMN
ncbi:GDP-mannose 4,6-dehydratase, partial [Lysobacter sp. 2RAB21]